MHHASARASRPLSQESHRERQRDPVGSLRTLSAVALLLVSGACISLPTPSGRPEVRVSVGQQEAKQRLARGLSLAGWMLTGTDDLGLSAKRPMESGRKSLFGGTTITVRISMTPTGSGGTEIRAVCYTHGLVTSDTSGGSDGIDLQALIEETFSDCLIDQPYVRDR